MLTILIRKNIYISSKLKSKILILYRIGESENKERAMMMRCFRFLIA
jgi:hypothetical protein